MQPGRPADQGAENRPGKAAQGRSGRAGDEPQRATDFGTEAGAAVATGYSAEGADESGDLSGQIAGHHGRRLAVGTLRGHGDFSGGEWRARCSRGDRVRAGGYQTA